jgi:2-methylcitrate dehydratase
VTLRDGRTAEHSLRVPHGHPKNPMSRQQIESKFRSMAEVYNRDPSALLDALWRLDQVQAEDVMKLVRFEGV